MGSNGMNAYTIKTNLFLSSHVAEGGGISQGLSLHDSLHIRRPAVLGGDDATWGRDETTGNDHLLNSFVENVEDDFAETLEESLQLLSALLLVLILGQLETLFGHRHQRLPVVFLQLLDDVLVDGFRHVQHFESSLFDSLDEGRVGDGFAAFPGDVVNLLLVLLHSADVILERRLLLARR